MAGVLPRWLWRTSGSREQTSTRRSSWTGSLFHSVPLSRHEGLMRRCNRKNHEKTQYQYTADAPSVMDALLYYDIAALHCFMALVLQHRLHLRGWRREILCSSLHEFQQFEKTILGSSWSFSCQVSFLNIQWSAMIRDLFCCQVKLHGCRATCGSGLVASCGILWHGNFVSTIGFVAPFLPRIIHLRFIRKNSVLRTATEQEVTLHWTFDATPVIFESDLRHRKTLRIGRSIKNSALRCWFVPRKFAAQWRTDPKYSQSGKRAAGMYHVITTLPQCLATMFYVLIRVVLRYHVRFRDVSNRWVSATRWGEAHAPVANAGVWAGPNWGPLLPRTCWTWGCRPRLTCILKSFFD